MTTLPPPFADDAASATLNGLTVENGQQRIAIYGSLDITRDQAGLAAARELAGFLAAVVAVLAADAHLPARIATVAKPATKPNPFA